VNKIVLILVRNMHEKAAKVILSESLCSLWLRHASRARMRKVKKCVRLRVRLWCVCVCVCVCVLANYLKHTNIKH